MMITKTSRPFKFVWRAFFGSLLALTGAVSSLSSSMPAAASPNPITPVRAAVHEPQTFLPLARPQSTSVTAPASAQPIGPVRSPQASPLVACTTLTVTPNFVSGQPSISHDGKRIAFWSTGSFAAPGLNADGNIEVFLYDQPSAKFTQVTSSTGSILGGFNLWPSISGDGTRLAFASDRNLTGGNGDGNFEIFAADLSGSGAPTLTQLTTTTVGVNTSPSMSGDGTRVAFVSNRDLLAGRNADQNTEVFVAAIAGTHLITYTQLTNSQGDIVNDEPSINNNGTAVAYIARGIATSTVYLSAAPFNAPKAIGAASLSVDVHPAISADGQRVIFVSDEDLVPGKNVSRTQQIFLYDNTAGLRQLTVTGNSADRCSPALSGNGLRVACVSDDQNVYLYSAATGTRGQLTSGGVNADPTINSDGQVIAYSQNGQILSSVCPVADIQLSKVGSPGTAKAQDPLLYTLVVSNAGPGIAQNVIISDPLPSGVLLDNQFVPDQVDDDHSTTGFIDAGMFGVSYQSGLPGLQLNSNTNAYELPNGAASTGWQDMTGNALLLHLNEQSGTSFSNSAPAGGAATCPYGASTTCPTLGKPGRLTTALGFNGTTNSAAYPDSGNQLNYGFNNDFTVMAWVNPGLNQASTSPADNSIIEKWDSSGGGYPFVIRMFNQAAGSNAGLIIAARYDTYNNPALYSTTKVNDNRWHHVAFVKRGGLLSLYVDGNQQSTVADTTGTFPCGFFGITCNTANNSAVYLGNRGGASNWYSGSLDEVAIFSRGLADAEIHNIYNHQSPFQNYLGYYQSRQIDAGRAVNWNTLSWRSSHPVQLQLPDNGLTETSYTNGNVNMTGNVALYHFNEANPYAGLADSSGNNNRAYAVYYYPSIGAGGVYANAIGFTGSAYQGIRAADSPSLRVGTGANSLTVEAWVNLRDAGANQKIVGKTPIGAGWLLGVGNHQIYSEVWQASGGYRAIQSGYIPDNQWTHLVMSWSSVGTAGSWHYRAYVNGHMYDAGQTCFPLCTGIQDTSVPLVIGSAPWDMSSYVVNGNIDEVAIYNRELTPAEVQDHYTRGAARLMFQTRTCSAACSTESFTGPDGTSNTYYTVQPSPSVTQSVAINVPPNPVFQYLAVLDTQDTSVLPDVTYVAVDPPHGAANASQGACALGVPVVCNVGTLNQGQVATVTIGSLLSQTVAAGQLPNTALAYSDADDINPGNNVATATTTIIQNVTLSILKTVTPQSAKAFDQVTYTLFITNNGSSPATNVVVSDTLPKDFLPQSAISNQFACPISGGVMHCTAGSLVSAATIQVPGKVVPTTSGLIVNTALVTSSEYYTGAMSTVTLTVPVLVDLGVKQDLTPATDAGAKLIYSVTVTNSNVSTAPGVVVNDTLDPDVTFVDGSPSANCSSGSLSSAVCALGTLAPGASDVFTIGVQVHSNATGSIQNTVQVDSSGSDSNPSNNQDTVTTSLTTHADLVVVKTGPSTVSAGDSLQYTLNITNNGPSDAHNVYITDTLPNGVSVTGVSSSLPFGLVAKSTTSTVRSWSASTVPALGHGQIVLTVQVTNTNAPAMIANTVIITSLTTPEVDASDNRSVLTTTVSAVAPSGVTIPSGITCLLGKACVITGTVNPVNASLPITFTWDATGYPQRVVVANSITGTVIFTFTTLGNQPVSVQADNSGGFGNGSGSVNVVAADLSLNKTGPASVSAGGVIQYTLTFSNTGTTSAQAVTIIDTLPAALTYGGVVGSLPSGFTQVGNGTSGVITFTASSLSADSVARSIVFAATVSNNNVPSQIVNSAQITTTTPDSQPGNNADTATTTVNPVTISSVSIDPPGACGFNSNCVFTATVSPGTASTPITFNWQAPDGNPTSASNSVSSITNEFTSRFNVHGTVYITVTASAYSVSATRGITIAIP